MIDNLKYIKGSTTIGSPIAIFEAAARDWSIVYFQPEQPVLEGELNLVQQSQNRRFRDLVRGIYPKGGVLKALTPSATGVVNQFRLHTQDQPFYAILDGLVKPVYAYDSGTSPTVGGNRVTMPAYTSGTYDQLVYLEVWFEEIMSPEGGVGQDSGGSPASASTTVYQYGMTGSFTFTNDVKVSTVPLVETTRRVQLRGEIKNVNGTVLTGVLAKGASGYGYGLVAGTNFYRAGNGSTTAGDALNSVDGYAYAIPLVRINRKASTIALGDIFLATDIIPTGSDVADQIIALQNRATALEDGRALQSITLTAGAGLTGGGDLSANRTFAIGTGQVTAAMLDATYWSTTTRRSDAQDDARFLQIANNLSDLANATTARTNLGLGAAATMGTTALRNSNVTTTVLQAKSMYDHTLAGSTDHDNRYYTEPEIDAIIAGLNVGVHDHNDLYYTEAEIDAMLQGIAVGGHTHDASDITSGTIGIARGGTGLAAITGTNFIRGNGAGGYTERTAAQVLTDIGAAASSHAHTIANVTDLQTALDGKATSSHVHAAGDITSGTLATARGGTGLASYTSGGYFYASSTSAMAQRTAAQLLADINAVAANTAIVGATKTKITYDAKGLVTAGADLAAADIPSLDAAKITTGTFGIARIPTGTTSSTVALGDHTHSSYLVGNAAITGSTKTKITYDSKGLVTAGADLSSSDIPSLDAAKITTGTFGIARIPTGTTSTTVSLGNHTHNYVASNTAITGATKTKITYDSNGLVTAGADLASGDIPDISATYVTLSTAQTITGAKTVRTTSGLRVENASTQDSVLIKGRAGGTASYEVTLLPTTLTADRTLTLPNVSGTVAVLEAAQSFTAANTFSSTVTISGSLLLPVK